MKRTIISLVIAMMLIMAMVGTALAGHNGGPCNDNGEPGNSDYAQHNIVPLATTGNLGDNIPGTINGFSVCNPSGQ